MKWVYRLQNSFSLVIFFSQNLYGTRLAREDGARQRIAEKLLPVPPAKRDGEL